MVAVFEVPLRIESLQPWPRLSNSLCNASSSKAACLVLVLGKILAILVAILRRGGSFFLNPNLFILAKYNGGTWLWPTARQITRGGLRLPLIQKRFTSQRLTIEWLNNFSCCPIPPE